MMGNFKGRSETKIKPGFFIDSAALCNRWWGEGERGKGRSGNEVRSKSYHYNHSLRSRIHHVADRGTRLPQVHTFYSLFLLNTAYTETLKSLSRIMVRDFENLVLDLDLGLP